MAYKMQTITYKDFGMGINTKSSPNDLAVGFSERLTNVDINNSSIAKRHGYQGHAGWLPLRAKEVQHFNDGGTGKLRIFFDNNVSLANAGVSPIVIYGHLSHNLSLTSGTPSAFVDGADTVHYYSTFVGSIPYTFVAPSGTVADLNPGVTADLLLVTQRNTVSGTSDSSWFLSESYTIDSITPFDASISWSGLPSNIDVFISNYQFTGDGSREIITNYTATAGVYAKTIDVSALENFTPVIQLYYKNGTIWTQFIPDSVTLSPTTAEVTITTNFVATTDIKALFIAPLAADVTDTTVLSGGGSVVIATDYSVFDFTVYTSNTMIYPDTVDYDSILGTATYSFASLPANTIVTICVLETSIQGNFLTVTTPGDTSVYTDAAPQLTVWGFNEDVIFDSSSPNGAKVMHIDTYQREGEARVMAGINGVLMKANTYDEAALTYDYGLSYVNLDARTSSSAQHIGPAFLVTGSTSVRTNGLLRATNISTTNLALCTSVAYVSAGQTVYTLSLAAKSGTLAACINTSYDYLTVTGFARSINNGTFKILSVNDTLNTITVSNTAITSNRYDETGALGRVGVFTDRFTVQTTSAKFLENDIVSLSSNTSITVQASDNMTVIIKGVTGYNSIAADNKVYGRRTTSVVPVVAATNFVRGDMLTMTGILNQPRILYINPDATQTCSITSNGTVATITATSPTNVRSGMTVILMSTSNYLINGEYVILATSTTSIFTVAATWVVTGLSASIIGPTLQLDESLSVYDNSIPMEVYTTDRWIPLEIPVTADTLPINTSYQHLPSTGFTTQSTARSTIIADNIYYTNGEDPVLKFDGSNVYRAGIQYWAAQLFSNVDTTTASIPLSSVTASATSAGNVFTVALGAQAAFAVGESISDAADSAIYTITIIGSSGGSGLITVSSSISGTGTRNINLLNRFKYYFRLNALDANNNIVAGAVTGLEDYVIDMSAAGQIKHRLVGLPAFDMYNYDSLDIEVYRTSAGSSGPYYRVGVSDINFNRAAGYILFTDATADQFLTTLDPVNTALLGTEVGTAWSQPLRAKYMTSISNKLVLMNITGYPQISAVLSGTAGAGSISVANLYTQIVTLRKDSNDTSTTTNMVDVARYQFVSTANTITSLSVGGSNFVITSASHGLVTKDWVYLYHSAVGNTKQLRFSGWWQVASSDTNTFTITTPPSFFADTGSVVDRWSRAATGSDVPVFLGTDGNYAQIGANILNELTAIQRLANAINATMRMTDVTLTGQTTFKPWITAAAGTTYGPGRIILRQDLIATDTFELQLTGAITGGAWYVDGTLRAASAQIQASTPIFPSRVLISYENYPEIFNGPDLSTSPATSVIDVNSSDGQEITGGLPFFGSSTFSASQQEQLLIVFKQNSIYAIQVSTGLSSKLRSRGVGCTAPYSIAQSRDGIMFANDSGLYKLDKGLNVTFAGVNVQTLYQEEVNLSALNVATATHYATGTAYKISLPSIGETKNSKVLVYNTQNEEEEGKIGAWTEYTNHPATGWANLGSDAYFGTSTGSVYSIRNVGNATDYRDDGDAVAEMVMLMRAEDFGTSGIRKTVPYVTTHMQIKDSSNTGTTIHVAYDLQTAFESAGTLNFVQTANTKVMFAEASMPRHKSNYIQIKYTNATKDVAVILAGIDYTVSGLSHLGVEEIGGS